MSLQGFHAWFKDHWEHSQEDLREEERIKILTGFAWRDATSREKNRIVDIIRVRHADVDEKMKFANKNGHLGMAGLYKEISDELDLLILAINSSPSP